MGKKISDFPKEAQALIERLLEDYPDIQAAVLLVEYDPVLKDADLASCFMQSQTEEFEDVKRFHSMCLHGANAVNSKVMCDLAGLIELYRTTKEKAEGETEDDS